MLARLATGGWRGSTVDKEITDTIRHEHDAGEDAGKYLKNLLPASATKEVRAIRRDVRDYHLDVTLPWQDTWRLLPVAQYEAYKAKMGEFEAKLVTARTELARNLPQYIRDAKAELGTMFNPNDYPTPEEMATRWTLDIEFAQVPDVKHFIADVAEEERAEIQANIQAQLERRISGTVTDLYQRIAEVIDWIAESLGKEKFSSALYKKVQEICELVPALNVTQDADLSAIVVRLRSVFQGIDPAQLRGRAKTFDAGKQQEVSTAISDLRAKMAGYVAQPEGE